MNVKKMRDNRESEKGIEVDSKLGVLCDVDKNRTKGRGGFNY